MGREASSEVRDAGMGAVFGRLEDGNLVARQKERYYAFLVPKSAVTIWLHGGAHQMHQPPRSRRKGWGLRDLYRAGVECRRYEEARWCSLLVVPDRCHPGCRSSRPEPRR